MKGRKKMQNEYFRFQQFCVRHDRCAMKVGTDGVLLGAAAECGDRALDIGTGTGLVALMLAQRRPGVQVTAIDIDTDACLQAEENVAASPFADRIKVIRTSLQDFCSQAANASPAPLYDTIVCNPPFYEDGPFCPDDKRTAARHAASLPFAALISAAAGLLAEDGTMTLIIPTAAVKRIEEECAYNSMHILRRIHIKTVPRKEPKRTLLFIGKHTSPSPTTETQCLMTADGQRSQWYAGLCKDFYTDRRNNQ